MAGGPNNQGQPSNYPYHGQQPGGYPQHNPHQPYGQPGPQPYPGYAPFPGKQHRGTIVLVLAILSWAVCPICGIVAIVMAKSDMKEMEQAIMDPSGMAITKAAFWVSVANLIFAGFVILLYAGIIALMILNILSGFEMNGLDEVRRTHLIAEATKLAYAHRDAYIGGRESRSIVDAVAGESNDMSLGL